MRCAYSTILLSSLVLSPAVAFWDLGVDGAVQNLQRRQGVPIGTGVSSSSAAGPTDDSSLVPVTSTPAPSPVSTSSSGVTSSTPQVTSSSPSSSPVSTPSASTPSPSSTSNPPTSTAGPSSSTSASASASVSSASPSDISASTSASASASAAATSTKPDDSSTTAAPSTTPQASKTIDTSTTVVIVSDGSTFSTVVPTTAVVPASSSGKPTGAPGLNGGSGDKSSSGLSTGQKNTIIGVVVGVVGALVLGGLAFAAWRVWGKKKSDADDDDDNDFINGVSEAKPSSDPSENTPFRSTLDQYHNPTGRVNASSNF